ncbi:MAG TPA: GlsB/YeaQ/YmgE family stress response membrane protein [Pirellulaceae bacterium]|nr:GlsB/YeaQ/YmgE family stress response membrane protein [Pirellulaceae bacterium]
MGTLGSLISWAVFGLVIGLIARMLYPGRQPMGFIATMVLGIVGSLLGGFVSYLFGFRPEEGAFSGGGWIMSIVGAMVVVWLGLFLGSRSTSSGMRPM